MKWRGGGHGGEVFHSVLFSSNTFLVVVFFLEFPCSHSWLGLRLEFYLNKGSWERGGGSPSNPCVLATFVKKLLFCSPPSQGVAYSLRFSLGSLRFVVLSDFALIQKRPHRRRICAFSSRDRRV